MNSRHWSRNDPIFRERLGSFTFPQHLRLDLADTLARQADRCSDLFQRLIRKVLASPPDWLHALLHADAEAHSEDALFASSYARQHQVTVYSTLVRRR